MDDINDEGQSEQQELVQAEAFELVSEGRAHFVNAGVDWVEYVEWFKGQEFESND